MGFHCDYYGKDWEDDDPACDDCEKWVSCKRLTLEKKQKKSKKSKAVIDLANRVSYSYHTNPRYILPAEGEPALNRIIKNAIAAALSAIGGEIFVFFQEWRWPFTPALPGKVKDEGEDNTPEEPKTKSKVAKKIRVKDVDDDDDEYDFDLDDL